MLTGKDLGKAIATAIEAKGIRKAALAKAFNVKPPSVQDWINRGTISKDKLFALFAFFEDVVGPEHWGLDRYPDLSVALQDRSPSTPPEVWPFPDIDRGRFYSLSETEQRRIQQQVRDMIVRYESNKRPSLGKAPPSQLHGNPRKVAAK